jgi:hypothetical protein
MLLNVHGEFISAGDALPINLTVANSGEETWADTTRPDADGKVRRRTTRIVATWVRLDPPADKAAAKAEAKAAARAAADAAADGATPRGEPVPLVVVLREAPLTPGHMVRIRRSLAVPEQTGHWALVVDIVDDVDGSFAALGSAPALALFEIVPPRGIEAVN